MEHILGHFQPKLRTGIWNIYKRAIFKPFLPNLGKTIIFLKNLPYSRFHLYGLLTSCKVLEKNIKRFTSNDYLKNPAIWLVGSFEPKYLRTRFFPDMKLVLSDVVLFGLSSDTKWAKTNDQILKYFWKTPILGHFGPFLPKLGQTRFFRGKSGSVTFQRLWSPNFMQKISKN